MNPPGSCRCCASAEPEGNADRANADTTAAIRVGMPGEAMERLSCLQALLTPREREVLSLLEDGATNRAIAERLFISEKTVSVHVSNVLAKLGVSHRGEAVALARRQQ